MDNSKIEKLLTEILTELKELKSRPVEVDAVSMLRQLSRGGANQDWIHFFEWNHRWMALLGERNRRSAVNTYDFIDEHMRDVPFIKSQMQHLETLKDEIDAMDGAILDLGVYKGGSTRSLAKIFPKTTIHGFDSFEGLPENWTHVLKGTFGEVAGVLPDMPDNVKLYKGWFSDTLPVWARKHKSEVISLLRVDCDIYSSTRDIFNSVGHMLHDRAFVMFDEYFGYRGWEEHEYRAFMEFCENAGYDFDYLAYGLTYCTVRLKRR